MSCSRVLHGATFGKIYRFIVSKRIVIINGHPDPESFTQSLTQAYKQGALEAGAEVQEIVISQLQFNPNLQFGYRRRMDLEPDLQEALAQIQWADHLVWVHPVWWGGFPALMKGFIDRVFLPGIAFRYRPESVWWDKLFAGKSARIITTLDQPYWYYYLVFGNASVNQLKRSILQFCGVKPVRVTYLGPIRNSTLPQREKWLHRVAGLGKEVA